MNLHLESVAKKYIYIFSCVYRESEETPVRLAPLELLGLLVLLDLLDLLASRVTEERM